MDDSHLESVAQLAELVKFGKCVQFNSKEKQKTYEWVGRALGKFRYASESKKHRSIIKQYLIVMTGYSEGNIDKLIKRKRKTGRVSLMERTQHTFPKKYTVEDIGLLAETMEALGYPNGKAAKHMFHDMFHRYTDSRFKRLANISVSHLYNLKRTNLYKSKTLDYTKTRPTTVAIGVRRKPCPDGKPGFLRVDSVHQGDLDKEKGVYHINLVDEVTQWEIVGCVEGISEQFLSPLLEALLAEFPFRIVNFHSDNGSEYINKIVAKLLNTLLVSQTKSRSRRTNDNALVEGKNAAVVRKFMGYQHIPKKHAETINCFYRDFLNPFINYHRHCAFATEEMDRRGKSRKKYDIYLTPCQKLLFILNVEVYLKPGTTRKTLEDEMWRQSHLKAAQEMQKEKSKLFKKM